MFYEIQVALDTTAARRETQRQNAARLAMSTHKVNSSGLGLVRIPEPVAFQVAFLEEPTFTQGAVTVQRTAEAVEPMGLAGVWQWERNPKGHWVGAYIYLSVWLRDLEMGDEQVAMTHHLLFQGVGYKDLGQGVATEAQMLSPRIVGFGV